jgi:hypothetical protein
MKYLMILPISILAQANPEWETDTVYYDPLTLYEPTEEEKEIEEYRRIQKEVLGWLMTGVLISSILIFAYHACFKRRKSTATGTIDVRLRNLMGYISDV